MDVVSLRAIPLSLLIVLQVTVAKAHPSATLPVPIAPLAVADTEVEANWGWIGRFLFEWGLGRALDSTVDKLLMQRYADRAASDADRISQLPGLSSNEQAMFAHMRREFERMGRILSRTDLDLEGARRRISANSDGIRALTTRLDDVEGRVVELERQQRRHYRMIVDNQARIVRLEGLYVGLDRRLTNVEGDVVQLQGEVTYQREVLSDHEVRVRLNEKRLDQVQQWQDDEDERRRRSGN